MVPISHAQNTTPFAFFGTPDVSSKTLELLKAAGYIPKLIITAPDRPVGRHFVMTPSPTKAWADENGIETMQPEKITTELVDDIRSRTASHGIELLIVVAYGKILPESLISMPKFGTLNIHYSLLPKYRGASPVESAILNGETTTGVSIQKMVYALDAGPIIAESSTAIEPNETTHELRDRLIVIGADLLARTLPDFLAGSITPEPQDESQMTHCGKIKKEDGLVNPATDNPQILWNKYRAYHGWPGIYFMSDEGKRIKITAARFEHGRFIIEKVIPEGKKEVAWG